MLWQPAASLENLHRRAEVLASIRRFFAERGVLEVETPLLAGSPVTDLHLHSVACRLDLPGGERQLFLQTSPEFAMKRLLAAGSGPIYQMARAVRDGEVGRHHNPEFTMLEWYRPGFDHHQLMDEVEELLGQVLDPDEATHPRAERLTYAEAFKRHVSVDPHRADVEQLADAARAHGVEIVGFNSETSRDDWLHLLSSHLVEPHLGATRPTFLLDYPASQAALARIRPGDPPVAERFELYLGGLELANGFHELTDPAEQRARFLADLDERQRRGLPSVPVDERLLAALEAGVPACAGVALGVDRLVMLSTGASSISDVLAFPVDRA